MTEKYKIKYERDMWGWLPTVWDTEVMVLVLHTIWPSFTREGARRRVAKAIARYERGGSYVEHRA